MSIQFMTTLVFLVLLMMGCVNEEPYPTPLLIAVEPLASDARFTVGRVVEVIDGVTIDVEIAGKVSSVRYLGIEIPEGNDLGERALQFNRFKVEGRTVQLEMGEVDVDAFGRLLRYVYVGGEIVNEAMLTSGYANVSSSHLNFKYATSFAIAEEIAKKEQRGVWNSSSADDGQDNDTPIPTPTQHFGGGTLPPPPGALMCDYTGTPELVIKGNTESLTGERLYYVPESLFYATTVVLESDGDRWFCTEEEAVSAGWVKSPY